MEKYFNIEGTCIPELHYMVDTSDKIEDIVQHYILQDKYFTINRARQFGKTTTLEALYRRLRNEYYVVDITFEFADAVFASQYQLANGMIRRIAKVLRREGVPEELIRAWSIPAGADDPMEDLSDHITQICRNAEKEIILMIDEVDKNSDNQVFLTFLGLLRSKYLQRAAGKDITFKSVILASVYDIKNMKLRMRPDEVHRYNSPWNVAATFSIDMSFSEAEIASMLIQYERDHNYHMDVTWFSRQLYSYTSGYPYLVSAICKLLDEDIYQGTDFKAPGQAWSPAGFMLAVKRMLTVRSTLFDDIMKKLEDHRELKDFIWNILMEGIEYTYNEDEDIIQLGVTLGILKESDGKAVIANRIFETRLYNKFIAEVQRTSTMYKTGDAEKTSFIKDGFLDMDLIVERFKVHYDMLYSKRDEAFLERECRFMFLTFLKPIINGVGNYYIEAETRDQKRTDIIVDYNGRQYIIELKLWRGEVYESKGRKQLCDYLDIYHQDKGWLISFCFNKNKMADSGHGVIESYGKTIVEVII